MRLISFNSLQTGKRIQRTENILGSQRKKKFQFPSNGKAYPKPIKKECSGCRCSQRVSIPFKRESVSKVGSTHDPISPAKKRFNSLQTGKRIQRSNQRESQKRLSPFQFPSNGKAYPKGSKTKTQCRLSNVVSIPFKRESVSKGRIPSV